MDIFEFGIGVRVMLVWNINIDDGLVNGVFGIIIGLEKSFDNIIKVVYIRFDYFYFGKKYFFKLKIMNIILKYLVRMFLVEDNLFGRNMIRK